MNNNLYNMAHRLGSHVRSRKTCYFLVPVSTVSLLWEVLNKFILCWKALNSSKLSVQTRTELVPCLWKGISVSQPTQQQDPETRKSMSSIVLVNIIIINPVVSPLCNVMAAVLRPLIFYCVAVFFLIFNISIDLFVMITECYMRRWTQLHLATQPFTVLSAEWFCWTTVYYDISDWLMTKLKHKTVCMKTTINLWTARIKSAEAWEVRVVILHCRWNCSPIKLQYFHKLSIKQLRKESMQHMG